MRLMIAVLLAVAACGGSDEITVEDGQYQIEWADGGAAPAGCETLSIRDDGLGIDWLDDGCNEPSITGGFDQKVLLKTTGCGVYPIDEYVWRVCPGPGYLAGTLEQDGQMVAEFAAFPL